jgi:hypothetical protein
MPRLVMMVFMVEIALLPKNLRRSVVDGVGVEAAAARKHKDKEGKELHLRSLPRKTARARLSMKAV